MNNREAWVGARFRNTVTLNVILVAALAFFLVIGVREIFRLLV
jgi:hypothetical protein